MIRTKLITTLLFTFFVLLSVNAQKGQAFLTIEDEVVSLDEFERIYKKNNQDMNILDKKTIEEYIQLFIDFKLKVHEAKVLGLDKEPEIIKEYEKYKGQLDKKYLTDPEITESLVEEAYERMKYEVNASHILVRADFNASPKDTAYAYNKIKKIRDRIINGEDFESVARSSSDDPSVKSNGGNLGYFTAFRMVYPFETAAYTTEVGKVSEPFRSRFGYHLLKVNDKRLSIGEIKVAHIMLRFPQVKTEDIEKELSEKANDIYHQLMNGESFTQMAAEYSEDPGTAKKGGELPWFGASASGQLPQEFIEQAFNLREDGMISRPFMTAYGFHIIKRIEKRQIDSYETMKESISKKVASDARTQVGMERFVEKLKADYNFTLYPERIDDFYLVVDSTILRGDWDVAKASDLNETLFSIADQNISQGDFAKYLAGFKVTVKTAPLDAIVYNAYQNFEGEKILEYEITQLPVKFPELKYLYKEYHDGILLFEVSDRMVWSRASKDTVNLKAYYEAHKGEYLWGSRAEIILLESDDENIINEAMALVEKKSVRKISEKYLNQQLSKDFEGKFKLETVKSAIGENKLFKELEWSKESYKKIIDDKFYLAIIKDITDNEIRTFSESKGLVISDYQKYLEDKWIDELRMKYKVVLNKDMISKIK